MASDAGEPFTYSHEVRADGAVLFACSTDSQRWPWLALDPFDPIVLQALNYFGAYEIAVARGEYKRGQWTALTRTWWTCGEPGVGHAVRGVAHAPDPADEGAYRLSFFDGAGALVCEQGGTGVVFKNRDFEAWRSQQKQALAAHGQPDGFSFAARERVGVETQIEVYVSALADAPVPSVRALITRDSGFPPAHPYHDGSGDHVNAGHLADAARQFLRLLLDDPEFACVAGEMEFRAYVELDSPFTLELAGEGPPRGGYALTVSQGDRVCARITLR
jgi:hypothetical protein